MEIRQGKLLDLASITDIFNYYIENTNARFEETPLSYEDRLQWFFQFSSDSKHQIHVALEKDRVLGFACSQPYSSKPAFEDTVEVTIYLDPEAKGKGLGSTLYTQLFEALGKKNIHRALSGVALPNKASVALHSVLAFERLVFSMNTQRKMVNT